MSKKNSVARYQRLNRPQYGRGRARKRGGRGVWRWILLVSLVGILSWAGWRAWTIYQAPVGRHTETVYILVSKNTTLDNVREQIQTKVWPQYPHLVEYLIDYYDLGDNLRPGRYAVTPEMTTLDMVRTLLSGAQTPVLVPLSGIRTEAELLDRFSSYMLISRDELQAIFDDSTHLAQLGVTREELPSIFLAGSYELLWDTSAAGILDTMARYHDRYWTPERKAKATGLGLSPAQVSTLASIVESESAKTDEYSRIAGLYLNRLRKGMKLQSDPTVIYALGDYSIRRVLSGHLQVASPYNTYQVVGLPPGPIRLVGPRTLDLVLDAEPHDYIYMCARDTFDGYHAFAADYATHLRNARLYQRALTARQNATAEANTPSSAVRPAPVATVPTTSSAPRTATRVDSTATPASTAG